MAAIRARVNEQGRRVIPADLRAAARIKPGSDVIIEAPWRHDIGLR